MRRSLIKGKMGITRPYRRTCRQFTDGSYSISGKWMYVLHRKYAKAPEQYIRAFLLLQKDLQLLFDYIEPSDINLDCYSYRTHELLLRACVEVEANCKAILFENGYSKDGDMCMSDYKKINPTHHLSSYEVKVPNWHGENNVRRPFAAWQQRASLPWYKAYNSTKHNRHDCFQMATFENMIDAICGVLVLLSAQFYTHDFSPSDWSLSGGGQNDGMESAIGGYFRVKFPLDWTDDERYDFNWQELKSDEDPFFQFDFS